MSTKIIKCKCEHEYQDVVYGKGNRVHNQAGSNDSRPAWRCTVCGDKKQ